VNRGAGGVEGGGTFLLGFEEGNDFFFGERKFRVAGEQGRKAGAFAVFRQGGAGREFRRQEYPMTLCEALPALRAGERFKPKADLFGRAEGQVRGIQEARFGRPAEGRLARNGQGG